MNQLRAILWAQWRSLLSMFPRSGVWVYLIGALWYGTWLSVAFLVGKVVASPSETGLLRAALPGALLLMILYWQVVPILLSATGASLDLEKLKPYPIPLRQLFVIETMLRATSAVEMLMVLVGASLGSMFNPKLPWASVISLVPFVVFNLLFAVGLRDLMKRMLRHKRLREIGVLVIVMVTALPPLILTRINPADQRFRWFFTAQAWRGWPWNASANLMQGEEIVLALAAMLVWCLAAGLFATLQFQWTYASDRQQAPEAGFRSSGRGGLIERFFRWPSLIFSDPLAALAEKEIRFLSRSPRFRLVFLMGFTFGLVIWLPISLGRGSQANSFLGGNYLTVVSIYSLLLLSEVCFWNSFGFDRSAAQIYFLAPVPFSRVLIGKNISALFFIALEIVAITVMCSIAGMPVRLMGIAEAYSASAVIALFLLSAGNILSVRQARGINPDAAFRSGGASRVQAMVFVVYPIALFPVFLAYLARYAFASELAFFGILLFDAGIGAIVYKLGLDSAVEISEKRKELLIAELSRGDGPIAA